MENKKYYFYTLYSYALLTSALYFNFYWIPFNIDVLPLVSILDVVKFSILPLVSLIPLFILYIFVSSWMTNGAPIESSEPTKDEIKYFKKIRKEAKYMAISMVFIGGSALLALHYLKSDFDKITYVITYIFLLIALFIIYRNREISSTINLLFNVTLNKKLFFSCIFLPIQLLQIPCIYGYKNGLDRATNTDKGYFISNSKTCKSDVNNKYIYITTLGGRALSISQKDSSICITDEKGFILRPI